MSKITPCIWFEADAEEAASFYVTLLPDSRVERVVKSPTDYPGGKAGQVLTVDFTLGGQRFVALNGRTKPQHTEGLSLMIDCADQAEVDSVWSKIKENGGAEIACGWIHDRWGVRWQVVPGDMMAILGSSDTPAVARAFEAMMTMVKLDVAKLKAAFEGRAAA